MRIYILINNNSTPNLSSNSIFNTMIKTVDTWYFQHLENLSFQPLHKIQKQNVSYNNTVL